MQHHERCIADEFAAERQRAHLKHGDTSMEALPMNDHRRHTILSEEVGEVAGALNDMEHHTEVTMAELRSELVQVGAMAMAWIAAIDGHAVRLAAPDTAATVAPCLCLAASLGGTHEPWCPQGESDDQ